jgi:WD40 repeat protein
MAQLEHSSQISALALGPDNSQLVSGTRDGNVVLWCLESFNVIQELPAHQRQVNGVRFSPDAKRVVSCGSDFYMKVIDLKTGTILLSKGTT